MIRLYENHLKRLDGIYSRTTGEREIREEIEATEQMMHLSRQRRTLEHHSKQNRISEDNKAMLYRLTNIRKGNYVIW
jgi:hypothetical protein